MLYLKLSFLPFHVLPNDSPCASFIASVAFCPCFLIFFLCSLPISLCFPPFPLVSSVVLSLFALISFIIYIQFLVGILKSILNSCFIPFLSSFIFTYPSLSHHPPFCLPKRLFFIYKFFISIEKKFIGDKIDDFQVPSLNLQKTGAFAKHLDMLLPRPICKPCKKN